MGRCHDPFVVVVKICLHRQEDWSETKKNVDGHDFLDDGLTSNFCSFLLISLVKKPLNKHILTLNVNKDPFIF